MKTTVYLIMMILTLFLQPRGRNILGVGDFSNNDGNWFFTLSYANGPGFSDHLNPDRTRANPQGMSYSTVPTMLPLNSKTHSAEDEKQTFSCINKILLIFSLFLFIFSRFSSEKHYFRGRCWCLCNRTLFTCE